MSFQVKEDFKAGTPVSAVPALWFNNVAHFLNNLVGGFGIKVFRDRDPPQICLNTEDIVTTSDDQTISGEKTFDEDKLAVKQTAEDGNTPSFHNVLKFKAIDGATSFVVQGMANGNVRILYNHDGDHGDTEQRIVDIDGEGIKTWRYNSGPSANATHVGHGAIELYSATPYVDFHYGNIGGDFTARIIEFVSGALQLVCANHAFLSVAPTTTDDTSTLEIPTLGWCNGKFLRKPQTAFSGVRNVLLDARWNDNGNKKLTKIYQQWTYENGLLINVGPELTAEIDSPVEYN